MDSKSSTDQYVSDCESLLVSMQQKGFSRDYPIPVDPNTELLGGAHRLACALALEIGTVLVQPYSRFVWAPAWDCEWFRKQGMSPPELERLVADWTQLASGECCETL